MTSVKSSQLHWGSIMKNRRSSLAAAIDYQWDEETVLGEISKSPMNALSLAYKLDWDSDRITKCLERLKDKGKAYKQDGKWVNRVVQLELFSESELSPLEQESLSGDRNFEKSEATEPTYLPQNKSDGRRTNCGSGYISTRAVNVKRNAAKNKPPNYCYYWHYSYTQNYKEVKKTVYLKLSQVPTVKVLIARKTPYQEILKWLKK